MFLHQLHLKMLESRRVKQCYGFRDSSPPCRKNQTSLPYILSEEDDSCQSNRGFEFMVTGKRLLSVGIEAFGWKLRFGWNPQTSQKHVQAPYLSTVRMHRCVRKNGFTQSVGSTNLSLFVGMCVRTKNRTFHIDK